VPSDIGIILHP